ncbi:MAG TPA: hydrogenase maturation nickel metallochaperone HypA [Jatrophihabitantaceae bacterium]|nr:hydrogenase maturation nickel metallochaperone HypA [Jatrophihabitantaceae bacterium]
MHELALCGAIADIVARRAGERPVTAVHVRIGELRQVVPDTLSFCWTMVTQDTDLDGARLEVDRVTALLRCRDCGAEHPMPDAISFACAGCGSLAVDVVRGEEFDITALELARV